MAFCSAVSYVLVAVLKWVPLEAPIEHDVYLRSVVPIGGLYALSLWCSNAAYMYLSVASIQMTKALMPVSVRNAAALRSRSDPTTTIRVKRSSRVLLCAAETFKIVLASSLVDRPEGGGTSRRRVVWCRCLWWAWDAGWSSTRTPPC